MAAFPPGCWPLGPPLDGLPRPAAPQAPGALPGPRSPAAAVGPDPVGAPGLCRRHSAPAGGPGHQRPARRTGAALAAGPAGARSPAVAGGPVIAGGDGAIRPAGHPAVQRSGGGPAAHRPHPRRPVPPCPGPVAAVSRPHHGGAPPDPTHQRCRRPGGGLRQRRRRGAGRSGQPCGGGRHDDLNRVAAGPAADGQPDSRDPRHRLVAGALSQGELPRARRIGRPQRRTSGEPAGVGGGADVSARAGKQPSLCPRQ